MLFAAMSFTFLAKDCASAIKVFVAARALVEELVPVCEKLSTLASKSSMIGWKSRCEVSAAPESTPIHTPKA